MKIFISVDLEGVGGYVRWDVADRGRERELITNEANAAISGAFEGGATEVLVSEAHDNFRNIVPELIDGRAVFLSGKPTPLNHMAGLDETFDGAVLVGYHSKAGTLQGVMAHSFSGRIFSLKFNGIEVGEIGADAAVAGHFNVPVIFVSGDDVACNEARGLIENVITVTTKEGMGRYAAKCLPLNTVYGLITKGVKEAVERLGEIKPFKIEPPITAEVVFIDTSFADIVGSLPFVRRMGGSTIAFEAEDFVDAIKLFNAIHFLGKAV